MTWVTNSSKTLEKLLTSLKTHPPFPNQHVPTNLLHHNKNSVSRVHTQVSKSKEKHFCGDFSNRKRAFRDLNKAFDCVVSRGALFSLPTFIAPCGLKYWGGWIWIKKQVSPRYAVLVFNVLINNTWWISLQYIVDTHC